MFMKLEYKVEFGKKEGTIDSILISLDQIPVLTMVNKKLERDLG